MKYVFNHYYILRHDICRSIIYSRNFNKSSVDINIKWLSYVHPIYAMLLFFFCKPITIKEAVSKISLFFDFSEEYTYDIVRNFIENKDVFHCEYCGINNFPKNIIIKESDLRYGIHEYIPEMFTYSEIDLDSFRLKSAPLYATFMVNNKCLTNCVYCYADRNTKCENMDFSEVERIIDDAYRLNLQTIDIDGGEFFMYPYWRKLLEKLNEREYKPNLISTKYPIKEKDIADFSKFGIDLQVSLDSINQNVLDKIVGPIKNYSENMQDTLHIIDKYMPFQVATILTKYNADVKGLECMYEMLCSFNKIKRWDIRVGFMSFYTKHNFEDIRIQKDDIEKIQKWIEEKQHNSKLEITWSPSHTVDFFKSKNGSCDFVGGRCSANTIHMFILPDGKVTICEQLYWKDRFIIGDLRKNNISEVWNSERALALANMSQEEYSPDSACRNCDIFDKCKKNMNSCYTNILKVYGEEHWDYPDPRCAKAPRNISENIYV